MTDEQEVQATAPLVQQESEAKPSQELPSTATPPADEPQVEPTDPALDPRRFTHHTEA